MNNFTKEELEKFVNQSELARHLDISRQQVSKKVKDGTLKLNVDKKIRLSEALDMLKANSNPAYKSKVTDTLTSKEKEIIKDNFGSEVLSKLEKMDFNEAKTHKERYLAGAAELSYLKETGELVSAKEVTNDAFEVAIVLREQLMDLPDRIGDTLAAEMDPLTIRKILDKELRFILKQIQLQLNKNNNKEVNGTKEELI